MKLKKKDIGGGLHREKEIIINVESGTKIL